MRMYHMCKCGGQNMASHTLEKELDTIVIFLCVCSRQNLCVLEMAGIPHHQDYHRSPLANAVLTNGY